MILVVSFPLKKQFLGIMKQSENTVSSFSPTLAFMDLGKCLRNKPQG